MSPEETYTNLQIYNGNIHITTYNYMYMNNLHKKHDRIYK